MSDRATRAVAFLNVTPERRRQPSWIAKQRGDIPAVVVAGPPRLPREMVAAFQQELNMFPESVMPPASVDEAPIESMVSEAEPHHPFESEGEPSCEPLLHEPALPDPDLLAGLIDAVEQLSRTRSEVLDATAGQLAELATLIARRVIAHELSVSPEVVEGLVREGLDALGEHDRVSIRVGSGFGAAIEPMKQRLSSNGQNVAVRVDPALSDFACVVETELGVVDESIEARLTSLLQALKPDSAPPL